MGDIGIKIERDADKASHRLANFVSLFHKRVAAALECENAEVMHRKCTDAQIKRMVTTLGLSLEAWKVCKKLSHNLNNVKHTVVPPDECSELLTILAESSYSEYVDPLGELIALFRTNSW